MPTIRFDTDPSQYRHWKLDVQGEVATLAMKVSEDGGLVPGYSLMYWFFQSFFAALGRPPVAPRQGALHWSGIYDVVSCRDGYCMVSPSPLGGLPALLEWLTEDGMGSELPEIDASNPAALLASLGRFMESVRVWARKKAAHDVFTGGQKRRLCFGEVLSPAAAADLPQLAARAKPSALGHVQPLKHSRSPTTRYATAGISAEGCRSICDFGCGRRAALGTISGRCRHNLRSRTPGTRPLCIARTATSRLNRAPRFGIELLGRSIAAPAYSEEKPSVISTAASTAASSSGRSVLMRARRRALSRERI